MDKIKVKYHNPICTIEKISVGDWIDLKSAETIEIREGDSARISLGVSMELPKGYEAILAPRSSLFSNHGLLMVNSIGIIDSSYCGDRDIWKAEFYATRYTKIYEGERIVQFRILRNQPEVQLENVLTLENVSRGGFGSTGLF